MSEAARPIDPAQAPLLSVRNLHTYFFADEGTVRAVDGASFEVFEHRTVGIVGESGCGKSMTARSILRLEQPARVVEGEILLRKGQTSIDLAAEKPESAAMKAVRGKDIGLVFQEPMSSFSPVHTIGSQIVEAVKLHADVSTAEAREQAIETLKRVGTPRPKEILDEYAWQLSGGLRQRAMIAVALVCGPNLLIADEPTTALDVTTQAQVLDLLRALQHERGMAIMLITHDLAVIAEMADEVVVMYLGSVVESGPVDDIFHAPLHPYTKALARSMPSVTAPPRVRLPTISGAVPHPFNRPTGCPFHPRCPDFMPGVCDKVAPPVQTRGTRHSVACHLYATSPVEASA
jgi:peptide/nickel transport system ATP-binding protein